MLVRRMARGVVQAHRSPAILRRSFARVRQHHDRSRRDGGQREQRDQDTAECVHEGPHHAPINDDW